MTNVVAKNNIITNNTGIGLNGTGSIFGISYGHPIQNFTSDYNNAWNNDTDYSNVTAGSHDLSQNPQFVIPYSSQAGFDYHPLPTSPLVDAGISHEDDSNVPTMDFEGNTRPRGPAFDIGAYEIDAISPILSEQGPTDGEKGVSLNSPISFTLSDSDTGVDINSLSYNVTGSFSGDIPMSLNVQSQTADIPASNTYNITLTPEQNYRENEGVNISLSVTDNAHTPNELNASWSFNTGGQYIGNGYLVTTPASDGGPQVNVYKYDGTLLSSFFAYDEAYRGSFNAITGNLRGTGEDEIITLPGEGFGPHLKVFKKDGTLLSETMVYDETFRGGLNAVTADFNGDGLDEIAVAPLSNGGPHVKVYRMEGNELVLLSDFMAYQENFRGGINLTASTIDNSDRASLLTIPSSGGGPHLKVFKYLDSEFTLKAHTFVYDEAFRGGADLTVGDLDGDSQKEIITAPLSDGGPNVRAYHYTPGNLTLLDWTMVYDEAFRGGVNLTSADLNGDAKDELVVAPLSHGGPNLRVYSLNDQNQLTLLDWLFVYDQNFHGGLNIKAQDLNDDGRAELVTSPRSHGGPNIRIYAYYQNLTPISAFWAYNEPFHGEVNIDLGRR